MTKKTPQDLELAARRWLERVKCNADPGGDQVVLCCSFGDKTSAAKAHKALARIRDNKTEVVTEGDYAVLIRTSLAAADAMRPTVFSNKGTIPVQVRYSL